MSRRQAHLAKAPVKKGMNPHGLYSGKVISVNLKNSTVDVKLFSGGTLRQVRVLMNNASTIAGMRYLASIKNVAPVQTPAGVDDTAALSREQDTIAIIGFLDGNSQTPRVVGFDLPLNSQMHLDEGGLHVFKHESGAYELLDATGTKEVHFPDGSHIIFGQRTSPKDMTAIQGNGQAFSTAGTGSNNSISMTIHLSQGITIQAEGGVLTINGGSAAVARVGDQVEVDLATGVGTITSGCSAFKA